MISGAAYFEPNTGGMSAQTTVQQYEAAQMTALTGVFEQDLQAFMSMTKSWEQQLGQTISTMMYEAGEGQAAVGFPPWYNAYVGTQTDPGQVALIATFLDEVQGAGVTGVNYSRAAKFP